MWTLAEASVECRVMSGATATATGETSNAEQRECAWGGYGHAEVNALATVQQAVFNIINTDAAISLRRADIKSRCDNRSAREDGSICGVGKNLIQTTTRNSSPWCTVAVEEPAVHTSRSGGR